VIEPVMESVLAIMKRFKAKLMAKMDAYEAKMLAAISSFLGKMEGSRECKELNPEEMELEHHEVPKKDAIVKPIKGRKKRHRGEKLAVG
jgi:hypothetical protein